MSRSLAAATAPGHQAATGARRWLILVHQLPPTPSNLRVRIWRRLQELGAVAVKQSVYVLPDAAEMREDFEWLKVEIEGAGGEAILYVADHFDPAAEAELIEQFRHARQKAYAELAADLHRLERAARSRSASPKQRRDLARCRERFSAIERLDFFGAAGRDRVVTLLAAAEGNSRTSGKGTSAGSGNDVDGTQYRNRVWVTRPRPGVDRMASAWLIRRFIDTEAKFGFVTDVKAAGDAIPFDMFGGGFGHRDDRCTFETLVNHWQIADPAVRRIGEIVHDLDLKEDKFGAPEAMTVGIAIEGLQLSHSDDRALLDQGMTLFEALYRSFAQEGTRPRPRAVVSQKRKTSRRIAVR